MGKKKIEVYKGGKVSSDRKGGGHCARGEKESWFKKKGLWRQDPTAENKERIKKSISASEKRARRKKKQKNSRRERPVVKSPQVKVERGTLQVFFTMRSVEKHTALSKAKFYRLNRKAHPK